MNAADIAVGRGDRPRGRALYERALASADGVAAIEWTAHAGLAQIAVLEHDQRTAARHFEAALATVEKTRSDLLKVDYKLSFLTQLIEFYRAYVDVLVAQGRNDRALEVAESSRARVLAERQRVDAHARVQRGRLAQPGPRQPHRAAVVLARADPVVSVGRQRRRRAPGGPAAAIGD